MALITCPRCGAENTADSKKCQECGTELEGILANFTDIERHEGNETGTVVQPGPSDKAKALRILRIIFGIVLLVVAFPCSAVGLAPQAAELPPAQAAIAATGASVFIAAGILLILGSGKKDIMYFVNAAFLAVVSLTVHPWSLGQTYSGSAAQIEQLYLSRHVTTVEDLFVFPPALGAILFGVLCVRKTQRKWLRIVSWICVGVGGIALILFGFSVVGLFS